MAEEKFSFSLNKLEKAIRSGFKVYGVFGSPVSHSLSPLMHNETYRIKKLEAIYLPFHVRLKELKKSLTAVNDAGISGLNITVPLKEASVECLDVMSAGVRVTGATNTITFEDGKIKGDNTDIDGFLRPLKQYIEPIKYESVAVFGCGGSARAVLYAILRDHDFPYIYLISRNREKAEKLLDEAELWKKGRTVLDYRDINDTKSVAEAIWECRLLVNCTPLGLKGSGTSFPNNISRFFRPGQVFYDLVYNPLKTPFISEGERHGGRSISGLSMFVEQGAKSFRIWTRKVMPRKYIYELLKAELGG